MAIAFPFAYVQDLGLRGKDAPAPETIDWGGRSLDAQGMRALHRALDPTIVLLCLAGYDPRSAVLRWDNSPAAPTIELFFDPRRAVVVDDFDACTGLPASAGSEGRLAIPIVPRAGLGDLPVPISGDIWDVITEDSDGGRWFDLPVAPAAGISGFAGSVAEAQDSVIATLAFWIANHFGIDGVEGTGLLAMLEPDLWDLPFDDPNAITLRITADAVSEPIFDNAQSLADFLIQDAQLRVVAGTRPVAVRDRLTAAPVPAYDRATARLAALGWKEAASNYWDAWVGEGWSPHRFRDQRRFSYIELVADAMNAGLFGNLVFDLSGVDVGAAYGGRAYEVGEVDEHIQELRDDLDLLGFGPLHRLDDDTEYGADWETTYGVWLMAAVREFQVYASMEKVARVGTVDDAEHIESPDPDVDYHHSYGSMLRAAVNTDRYEGPKSGVLNDRTRVLLKRWVEEEWVCPVAVEARTVGDAEETFVGEIRKGRPESDPLDLVLRMAVVGDAADLTTTASTQNLWGPRQHAISDLFVAWDVSGTRRTSATTADGDPVVLCAYSKEQPKKRGHWGGPYCGYNFSGLECLFAEAEILQVGRPYSPVEQRAADSTFRVLRAIAEVESVGYYDGINAYDTAILSGGLLHATLGLHKNTEGNNPGPGSSILYSGELAAILAFYEAAEPEEYERSFGQFGLHALNAWEATPEAHFRPAHAKYADGIGFEAEGGGVTDLRQEKRTADRSAFPESNRNDWKLGETLHSWHWVYRWLVADRADTAIHRIHDEISRARVRALLSVPWPDTDPPLRIGDVLTSERAVALAERLHVFNPRVLLGPNDKVSEWGRSAPGGDEPLEPARPGDVTLGSNAAEEESPLWLAMNAARDVAAELGHDDVADWGDDEEYAIVEALQGHGSMASKDFGKVRDWPGYPGRKGRKYAPDGITHLAEPQPTVEVAATDIADGVLRVTVGSVATEKFPNAESAAELFVEVTSSLAEVQVTVLDTPSRNDTDVRIEPGEWRGTVTLTIRGKSRRLVTQRTQVVVIGGEEDEAATFAAGALSEETIVDPSLSKGAATRGLSARRHSFELDERNLFPQPVLPGW